MEREDLEQVRRIFEESLRRDITPAEERTLREVMGRYSHRAWELPRWALLDAADYAVATHEGEPASAQG